MADNTVTLTSPFGSTVRVAKEQVDNLLAAGFTKAEAKTTSKSSSSKSSK